MVSVHPFAAVAVAAAVAAADAAARAWLDAIQSRRRREASLYRHGELFDMSLGWIAKEFPPPRTGWELSGNRNAVLVDKFLGWMACSAGR